jgi:hypothetical protein
MYLEIITDPEICLDVLVVEIELYRLHLIPAVVFIALA